MRSHRNSPTGLGCNPDFINVDLTVGHSFGKWQVAWVGYYSSDLTEPILGYAKQSQFVSYLIGAYFEYNSPVAWSDTSLNQRFAISYTGNDWAITANVIYGTHLESVTDRPQLSPCPIPASVQFPTGLGCNPDFINVDLTVGHSFGKWQVAWVGYYSSDLTEPILGYAKQSQFAMGGLLGYDFGAVILQGYLTTDVYERNYGGHDIRGWVRVVLPLNVAGAPFGPPAAAPVSAPVRGYR